jgi:hypothetical protein
MPKILVTLSATTVESIDAQVGARQRSSFIESILRRSLEAMDGAVEGNPKPDGAFKRAFVTPARRAGKTEVARAAGAPEPMRLSDVRPAFKPRLKKP